MLALTEPKQIVLRDYQSDAIEGLRQEFRGGKRAVILCAATGAGKTVCAAHLLKEADRKGKYALFLVDRVALVNQTSDELVTYGIQHGVLQGLHPREDRRKNVQVCSIQTLANRTLPRAPELIVWDECHTQYQSILDFLAKYPATVKVGLTATPFTKGMGKHWQGMVNVISARQLIHGGHLIEPKMYVAKSPDDSEFGLNSFGEFTDESASEAGVKIIGDVVAEWIAKTREHFGGPAKTIVFSPDVNHGIELCRQFNEAGYCFRQVSYLDKKQGIDRDATIAEFRRPDSVIDGLVSCGVLTKGFNVPDTLVGISCKPYRKSLSSHMQEIGRIMRPAPGKTKALWLDHAGNLERFALDMYDVWENGPGPLDKSEKRDSEKRERNEVTREKVVCPECSGAVRAGVCMCCGWEKPARSSVTVVDGKLELFSMAASGMQPRAGLRAECLNDPKRVWNAALYEAMSRSTKGEDHARKWAFGVWRGVYPTAKMPRGWYDMAPGLPAADALALVQREMARWRKSVKSRRAA